MSETTTTEAAEVAEDTTTTVAGESTADNTTEDTGEHLPGEEALGDKGKKALDTMKAKWKAAEDRAKAAEAAAAEALAKAEGRILKAEVKAAAKGVLADPADAFKFLDLSSFEVGDDGDVDADAVSAAINDLIASKPYLSAQGGRRFQGGADGGTRKETRPAQLTHADLAGMSPDQIVQAKSEGRLNDLLGVK